jgi:hypothetical protein
VTAFTGVLDICSQASHAVIIPRKIRQSRSEHIYSHPRHSCVFILLQDIKEMRLPATGSAVEPSLLEEISAHA